MGDRQLLVLGVVLCLFAFSLHVANSSSKKNSELTFKGKQYVLAGLQGAGYTRENRSPVYTLVVMAKEDAKKWIKR